MSDTLLKVKNITVRYGKATAVDGLSLEVPERSVIGVIGANGAGKTSIMRAISGLIPLYSGEIYFKGEKINGTDPSEIVKQGIVQVPEGRMLFPYLTVKDNLWLGASLIKDKKEIRRNMEMVFDYFPILKDRENQLAGTMSGGQQEMLAIGRGLMASPKLLIMDEPSLGLAPVIIHGLVPVIKDINKNGVSVLLVEQNIPLALDVAHSGYALKVGRIVLEGDIDKFKQNEKIKQAYFGA